jgi:hypothetical protein
MYHQYRRVTLRLHRQYRPGNKEFDQLYQQLTFYTSNVISNTQIAVLDLRSYMEELNKITDMDKRDEYISLIANAVSYKVFLYIRNELLRRDKPTLVTAVVSSHMSFELDEENTKSAVLSKDSDLTEYEGIIQTVFFRLRNNKQSKYNKIVLLFNYFC